MATDLKSRLLGVAGAMAQSDIGNGRAKKNRIPENGGDGSRVKGQRNYVPRRARTMTEEEVRRRLKSKSGGKGNARLCRQFLQRLATALHLYGSSSSRTEYLIENVANKLDVDVAIAVFPSLILLKFPGCEEDDAINVITVEGGLDVDKLGRVDQLANHAGSNDTPLLLAYWRLKAIATSPSKFGHWWCRLGGYTLSAPMCALLFFQGSFLEGLVSLALGFIVGILDLVAEKSALFCSVKEFATALVVSTVARLFSLYLDRLSLCFFPMVLASLVLLLPGLALTLGVSEMVSRAHVTGTSRIMYALFSALQLGFGIAVGENLVFWAPQPSSTGCDVQATPWWLKPLWFAGFSTASNTLLNARFDQWPGMIVTSGVGLVVSNITSLRLDASASSVIAAFAVGLTSTIYSQIAGELPLVMVLSGILLLVPGGIGVQGVAAMLQDDVLSGMGFVFQMMVVGLSITIGLLLSKLVLPAGIFGYGKTLDHNKRTIAAQLEDDEASETSSSDEENMAI